MPAAAAATWTSSEAFEAFAEQKGEEAEPFRKGTMREQEQEPYTAVIGQMSDLRRAKKSGIYESLDAVEAFEIS